MRRALPASTEIARAIEDLDALTRRLRRDCPWDREQDERSIVPHTVEEAYELADAAIAGEDAKLLDELGDVLFQVCFLSLLLEERGAGNLAQVADHCRQKLIRRHPHVFGKAQADDVAQVVRNWDRIKAGEAGRGHGVFGELPESLPALLYARKVQRRAATAGLHPSADAPAGDEECFRDIGERLFALVDEARCRHVDPELALRAAAQRFREKIGVQ
jgi:nucleoside triphosphate diphosphatase